LIPIPDQNFDIQIQIINCKMIKNYRTCYVFHPLSEFFKTIDSYLTNSLFEFQSNQIMHRIIETVLTLMELLRNFRFKY